MKEEIYEIIKQRHEETHGHNGISSVAISQKLSTCRTKVEVEVQKLLKEEKIEERDHIHGTIYMIKK